MIELPAGLQEAVDLEVQKVSSQALVKAAKELSDLYRRPDRGSSRLMSSALHHAAYLATRMPATYGAVYASLEAMRKKMSQMPIKSILDLGAGPGTAMWAIAELFPELEEITLMEQDGGLIQLGKQMSGYSTHPAIQKSLWLKQNLTSGALLPQVDLIVSSYAIGELEEKNLSDLFDRCWNAARLAVLIIEPGTPTGFKRVMQARDHFLRLGGGIFAPCPHSMKCPLEKAGDWCHFSQRVLRSRLHRHSKEASLPYEDEKFSYVAISKAGMVKNEVAASRIVRHPLIHPGYVKLTLCEKDGETRLVTVSKKNKEAFRLARKAEWGHLWPPLEES